MSEGMFEIGIKGERFMQADYIKSGRGARCRKQGHPQNKKKISPISVAVVCWYLLWQLPYSGVW
jgi:hypothetical protein